MPEQSIRKSGAMSEKNKEGTIAGGSSYPTTNQFPGGYPRMPPPINYPYPPMMHQNGGHMPSMYGYPPYSMPHYPQNKMYHPRAPPVNHQQQMWEQQKRMMDWNMAMTSGPPTIPSEMVNSAYDSLPSSGANYDSSFPLPSVTNTMNSSTYPAGITKSTLPSIKSDHNTSAISAMGTSPGTTDEFLPSELYDFFLDNGNLESDSMDPAFSSKYMVDDFDLLPLNNDTTSNSFSYPSSSRSVGNNSGYGRKRKINYQTTSSTDNKDGTKIVGRSKERNREHAKKARVKKKIFLDCLKEKIKGIEDENRLMRRLIEDRTGMPFSQFMRMENVVGKDNSATPVNQEEELFDDVVPKDNFGSASLHLLQHLQKANQNFTITNPHLPDNPIIYASQGFYDMCGYDRSEVLGRNCRFLQGPLSDRKNIEDIRNCISTKSKKGVCILNYKKDGTPFWNYVFISPLTSADGRVIMFIGVQCVLSIDDATSVIDTAAEIAAECVNAENPQKAADEAVKKVRLDGKGGMVLDGGVFGIEGVKMLESKPDEK